MESSLVFYILVAAIVLVESNARHEKGHKEFDEYREINCLDVRADIGHTLKNSICKPRDTHVFLKPKPGYQFHPPMVTAKRCGGHCPPGFAPTAMSTTVTTFAIKIHPKGNPTIGRKCVLVDVLEHTKCSCKCPKAKRNCNDKQIYEASSCSCKCKDQEERRRSCEAQLGKLWDDEDCSCN